MANPNLEQNNVNSTTVTPNESYEFDWSASLIPRPLSYTIETIKKQLPVTWYKLSDEREGQCAVCLNAMEAKELTRDLHNCSHVFHKQCLDAWIDNNNVTCPLCRADLLYENGADFMEVK
ncbi:RING-type domain-containing protein [Heracleum sosnowskyi]|uniref:RING-type domain-containing protein n=1 Tax=Heracleum sosnowskyi TaxID=360622 RepID=A0AAD8IVV1_9APIA|nr:RING-type domain-containing protein [Heracleum sosnowskyi]